MNKEREAFEDWFACNSIHDHVYVRGERMDEKGIYHSEYAYLAWEAWQASAQREGYKLVPVEINDEIESAMFSSVARGEMPCDIYKAMIGAQESIND